MPLIKKPTLADQAQEKDRLDHTSARDGTSSPPPAYVDKHQHPPQYDAEDLQGPPDITAGFSSLSLSTDSSFPARDQCIAHLKLLECFYRLRQKVGSFDGLFGIHNASITAINKGVEVDDPQILSILSEKRWAIYVSRAVDRFEHWRNAVAPSTDPLVLSDCQKGGRLEKLAQREVTPSLHLDIESMPPLDVLMIWHSYMLNPRVYLEDCLRGGHMSLWHSGMPWDAIAQCISNETFDYNPAAAAKELYPALTGDAWENLQSPENKDLVCSECRARVVVPWTTYSADAQNRLPTGPLEKIVKGVVGYGSGYADPKFDSSCTRCRTPITLNSMAVDRFLNDVRALLAREQPMAGTVLGMHGIPGRVDTSRGSYKDTSCTQHSHFPNNFLSAGLGKELLTMSSLWTMDNVKDEMERYLKDKTYVRKARGSFSGVPIREERIFFRKMMSRYWNNPSPFGLDLVGAVVRQGSFIEKMHGIDWLHSPALHNTMKRLLIKYERFFGILQDPQHMAVPTLDVDLAWHTHQLSPYHYLQYSVDKTRQFIDHDDKVAETKLNDSFAWTSKTYQRLYNEPYSECTCWYCEAVRESHTSTFSRVFNGSNAKAADTLHQDNNNSSHNASSDPRKSVHISTHNAVRPTDDTTYTVSASSKARALDSAYQKACTRAQKKGRPVPKKDEFYYSDAYGYPVYMPLYMPYVGPMPGYGCPDVYPAGASCMALAPGATGNCCAGTCGGGVAAGSCGSGGAGCAGGSAAGGCGGGSGGGGGCGGGGGGGGCGGGGGGGGC